MEPKNGGLLQRFFFLFMSVRVRKNSGVAYLKSNSKSSWQEETIHHPFGVFRPIFCFFLLFLSPWKLTHLPWKLTKLRGTQSHKLLGRWPNDVWMLRLVRMHMSWKGFSDQVVGLKVSERSSEGFSKMRILFFEHWWCLKPSFWFEMCFVFSDFAMMQHH